MPGAQAPGSRATLRFVEDLNKTPMFLAYILLKSSRISRRGQASNPKSSGFSRRGQTLPKRTRFFGGVSPFGFILMRARTTNRTLLKREQWIDGMHY
jgi:hypothetical protein